MEEKVKKQSFAPYVDETVEPPKSYLVFCENYSPWDEDEKNMIRVHSNKELEDLQSRSCENCYESKTCKILHSVYKDRLKKEGYAMHKNEFKCGFWHSLF